MSAWDIALDESDLLVAEVWNAIVRGHGVGHLDGARGFRLHVLLPSWFLAALHEHDVAAAALRRERDEILASDTVYSTGPRPLGMSGDMRRAAPSMRFDRFGSTRRRSIMDKPTTQMVRAIDVKPHRWAVWSSIGNGEPFTNEIAIRRWSDDGTKIWFMLESHNFLTAAPDEEIELVPLTPKVPADMLAAWDKRDEETMSKRPGQAEALTPPDPAGTIWRGEAPTATNVGGPLVVIDRPEDDELRALHRVDGEWTRPPARVEDAILEIALRDLAGRAARAEQWAGKLAVDRLAAVESAARSEDRAKASVARAEKAEQDAHAQRQRADYADGRWIGSEDEKEAQRLRAEKAETLAKAERRFRLAERKSETAMFQLRSYEELQATGDELRSAKEALIAAGGEP